jgi:pimeloyl-ACP methyl ester carboxylesterase
MAEYDTIMHQAEQQVDVKGIRINYDAFGDRQNPAIILIMGLATQMIFWDEGFCRQLAANGFWVLRFDNRDIGKSSWMTKAKTPGIFAFLSNGLFGKRLKAPYLLSDMAADTLGLLDSLKLPQVHLVGVSMGGMIAQTIAIEAPQRVLSLTSIMSTTGDRTLPKPKKSDALKLMTPPPKEKHAYIKHAADIWQLLHGSHFHFEREKIELQLGIARERGFNPQGISRQLAAIIASPDRTDALAHLNMPCLVIHGDNDPLILVECGRATAKAINQAELLIYPGMGHTLPSELHGDIIEHISQMAQSVS